MREKINELKEREIKMNALKFNDDVIILDQDWEKYVDIFRDDYPDYFNDVKPTGILKIVEVARDEDQEDFARASWQNENGEIDLTAPTWLFTKI